MWSERAALGAATLGAFLAAAGAAAQTPETTASPSPVPSAAPAAPAPIQNVQPTPAPSAAPAAPEPVPSPTGDCSPDAAACITAGQSERFGDGHTQFRGFVDLIFGDTRIQTDRLDIYQMEKPDGTTARRVVAEGNVVFMRGDERLSGEKLDMQLDTSRGTFENAFGYLSPGVLVEGKRIERVGPNVYRIEDGKFTSCMQPNPRWSFTASSATLQMDDKVKARNVFFRVKDVPAFYIPYFVYPIQEDQRSTGILFPHFGQSGLRGFNIGGGFFWAMSRSYDQTFYADHYSKFGWGFGHEFRYLRPSPSRGTFRTYLFRRTGGGATEHDLNWDAIQSLPGKVRASLRVQETSTVQFQEQFQENLDLASQRNRYWTATLQRSFGPTSVQLQADSTDTFFFDPDSPDPNTFDRRRHFPSLTVNMSPKKHRKSGLVFAYESRAEALQLGNQDHIDKYDRFDFNPRISRPLSRSFLQLTPQVQARYTRYGSTYNTETGALDPFSIQRKYVEGSLEMRGPSFSRVFNTPGNFYSERYKHVFVPEVTYTYRSKFEEFDSIPRFDYLDFFPGTNEVRYGFLQQIYAKRPGRSGKLEPYEFLSWRVGQTYYVDIASGANLYDPNYSSAVFDKNGNPAHLSPLQSRLRIRPTPAVSTNFDLEYDVNFREIRSLSLSTSVNYRLFGLDARWFRGTYRVTLNRTRPTNTMRGSARVALWPGKLTAAGSADYDVINKTMVQSTARLRYDVQCCGFVAEMINSKYNLKNKQYRFSIELANIGSIGNFMGQEAGANNRGFLSGR